MVLVLGVISKNAPLILSEIASCPMRAVREASLGMGRCERAEVYVGDRLTVDLYVGAPPEGRFDKRSSHMAYPPVAFPLGGMRNGLVRTSQRGCRVR